jgi:hypothetical protein
MKGGEKMEKGQLWTIVGVALVVAVVASIATASITGNVIKLNQDRYGQYKVYTTAEIDAKLKDFATNQGILNMLNNKCIVVDWGLYGSPGITNNCNQLCNSWGNKTCIGGLLNRNPTKPHFARPIVCADSFTPSNDTVAGMSCICCSQ